MKHIYIALIALLGLQAPNYCGNPKRALPPTPDKKNSPDPQLAAKKLQNLTKQKPTILSLQQELTEVKKLQQEKEELVKKLQLEKEKIEYELKIRRDLAAPSKDLTNPLNKWQEKEDLIKKLTNIKERYSIDKTAQELQDEKTKLETEKEQLKTEKEQLKAEKEQLKAEKEQLKAENTTLKEEQTTKENQLEETEKKATDLENREEARKKEVEAQTLTKSLAKLSKQDDNKNGEFFIVLKNAEAGNLGKKITVLSEQKKHTKRLLEQVRKMSSPEPWALLLLEKIKNNPPLSQILIDTIEQGDLKKTLRTNISKFVKGNGDNYESELTETVRAYNDIFNELYTSTQRLEEERKTLTTEMETLIEPLIKAINNRKFNEAQVKTLLINLLNNEIQKIDEQIKNIMIQKNYVNQSFDDITRANTDSTSNTDSSYLDKAKKFYEGIKDQIGIPAVLSNWWLRK